MLAMLTQASDLVFIGLRDGLEQVLVRAWDGMCAPCANRHKVNSRKYIGWLQPQRVC